MRIDELVDGLIDPNAVEEAPRPPKLPEAEDEEAEDEDEEDEGGAAGAAVGLAAATEDRSPGALQDHQGHATTKMQKALASKGLQDKAYLKLQAATVRRADEHPLHLAHHRTPVRQRARHGRAGPRLRAQDPEHLRGSCARCRARTSSSPSRATKSTCDWVDAEIAAAPKTYVRHPDPQRPGHPGRAARNCSPCRTASASP